MRFWSLVVGLIAVLAASMAHADRQNARAYREQMCRQFAASGAAERWAERLGVGYDELTVTCGTSDPRLSGKCRMLVGPISGDRVAHVWLDPHSEDDLELILVHEMLHFAHPDWPDERIEREARRLWRQDRSRAAPRRFPSRDEGSSPPRQAGPPTGDMQLRCVSPTSTRRISPMTPMSGSDTHRV